MCIITQWIRKRREQRQRREERKREAERRIQRETQDHEYSRILQLTLDSLQHAMDPLIASQAYNNRYCPLTRLPEELLVIVLEFLRGDDVTLCCLRITSRTFLRLLYCQSDIWTTVDVPVGPPLPPGRGLHLKFRRLLQRDGRCENCRRWNDANVRTSHDPCKFQESCTCSKFYHRYGRPHCAACDITHDIFKFPRTYQHPPISKYLGPRLCLGRQGAVQLCEHVQIAWGTIKAHIDDWRRRQQQPRGEGGGGPGGAGAEDNLQAWLRKFVIECHDPTHDTRCTASEVPTWPRARLGITRSFSDRAPDIVVLYLEWTPHGRIDALMPRADGRIPAPELRALFRKFRRLGPADILYPPGRPGTLPEMACFAPLFPIHYKMEEQEESEESAKNKAPPPTPASLQPPTSDQPWKLWLPRYYRSLIGRHEIGKNSQRLDITSHYLSGADDTNIASQCLMVNYQKAIMICQKRALTDPGVKLIPSEHWLHAMDPRTYPHPQDIHFRPQCRDESCANYYRRPKNYYTCRERADSQPLAGNIPYPTGD